MQHYGQEVSFEKEKVYTIQRTRQVLVHSALKFADWDNWEGDHIAAY